MNMQPKVHCFGKISRKVVPEEGLEPSHTHVRQILSLLRLPFRHSGKKKWSGRRESNPRSQLGRLELCH